MERGYILKISSLVTKRMTFVMIIAAFIVTTLSSCGGNNVDSSHDIPLSFTAHTEGLISEKSPNDLPLSTQVGIYVTAKDADITHSYYINRKYTSTSAGVLTSSDMIYLTTGLSYDIYAYSPYTASGNTSGNIEFQSGTDILWTPVYTLTNVSTDNQNVVLNFQHLAAEISFNVVLGEDYTGSLKSFNKSSTITVSGFYEGAILNLSSGELNASGSTSVSLSGSGDGQGKMMIAATCFVPTQGMQLKVSIIHDGETYNGTITDNVRAGYLYNYAITLHSVKELGISTTIDDWKAVQGGTGDIK